MSDNIIYWMPQPGPQTEAFTCPADEIFFGGSRGGGKGSPYHTEIITPFGIKYFSDVHEGMQICNPDGTVAKIVQVFELGERDIYTITFDDGVQVEVTDDHLWLYRFKPVEFKANRSYLHNGEECNWRVNTTSYLKNQLQRGVRIPLTKPVSFTLGVKKPIGMDPYLLGLILGDGHITKSGAISLSTEDFEIAEYLVRAGFQIDAVEPLWVLRANLQTLTSKQIKQLKLAGKLADNKYIPHEYKFGSEMTRWAVLQGLMDTDGYADKRGHLQFASVSKQLAEDVQFLVRSLGGKATITSKIGQYRMVDGSVKQCKEAYMLYIQLPDKTQCFRLPRKRNRCVGKEWNAGIAPLTRKMVSIEKTSREKARCIRVDHPNGLYLTDDFIVTHNSDCAIGRQIDGAMRYGVKWNGMMVRKKYKDFREIRRRFDELIIHGLPAKRVGGDQQLNFIRFKNGANIILSAMGSVEAADDWVGHQFTEISFEEAPQLPYIGPLIDKLKGSLRSPHGVPTHMFMTGNPGGPGASQIKAMFIPVENGGDLENVKEGRINWVDVEQEDGSVVTINRVFIRSDLRDNKILCDNDPKYVNTLLSIQDPARRAAWIEGRWDVFIGQAFDFSHKNIVQNPIWPIPEFAPVFMTFDWGFGAPFSVIWSWVDSDGRIYACREWYGHRKKGLPNIGLRLTDQEIIEGILEREQTYGLLDRPVTWLLGPDCFRKKANYLGGGQGPATSDAWADYLARPDIIKKYGDLRPIRKMIPGDATKETKMRQFRNRIASDPPGEPPMLMVYPECQSVIRTIPTLCTAETNVEELEDGQEDHSFDSVSHVLQYHPIGTPQSNVIAIQNQRKSEAKKRKLDSASRAALEEWERTCEELAAIEESPVWLT